MIRAPYREYTAGVTALYPVMGLGGLGDATKVGTSITGAVGTIAGANSTAIAGTLGVAVPVVGIAIAAITMAITAWLNRMGPKQKRWTTQIANDATAQLQAIQRTYNETPYNPANQAAALAAVDQMLQAIQDGCGQSQMGEPGRRCIAERLVRGGSAPWCPTGTGCDYLTAYRDPIANDPRAAEWAAQAQAQATTGPAGTVNGIADSIAGAVGGVMATAGGDAPAWILAGLAAFFLFQAVTE